MHGSCPADEAPRFVPGGHSGLAPGLSSDPEGFTGRWCRNRTKGGGRPRHLTVYNQNSPFEVNDDISSGQGDREDWIAFKTIASENNTTRLDLTLTCSGDTNGFSVRIWDDAGQAPVPTRHGINCATGFKQVTLLTNHYYLARVHYPNDSDEPRYTEYVLGIEN
jgi:hypothetical protein